jgi:hypothetical protein
MGAATSYSPERLTRIAGSMFRARPLGTCPAVLTSPLQQTQKILALFLSTVSGRRPFIPIVSVVTRPSRISGTRATSAVASARAGSAHAGACASVGARTRSAAATHSAAGVAATGSHSAASIAATHAAARILREQYRFLRLRDARRSGGFSRSIRALGITNRYKDYTSK